MGGGRTRRCNLAEKETTVELQLRVEGSKSGRTKGQDLGGGGAAAGDGSVQFFIGVPFAGMGYG